MKKLIKSWRRLSLIQDYVGELPKINGSCICFLCWISEREIVGDIELFGGRGELRGVGELALLAHYKITPHPTNILSRNELRRKWFSIFDGSVPLSVRVFEFTHDNDIFGDENKEV